MKGTTQKAIIAPIPKRPTKNNDITHTSVGQNGNVGDKGKNVSNEVKRDKNKEKHGG